MAGSSDIESLNSTDTLGRFLLSSSDYAATKGRVKPRALMPNRHGQTSVFVVEGLENLEIWRIGKEYVSEPIGRTLHGRADFTVEAVHQVDLSVHFDNDPPRHADIVDWPEEKSAKKLVAQELAAEASLVLNEQS